MWSVETLLGKEKKNKYQRSFHQYEKPSFRDLSKHFVRDRILDSSRLRGCRHFNVGKVKKKKKNRRSKSTW